MNINVMVLHSTKKSSVLFCSTQLDSESVGTSTQDVYVREGQMVIDYSPLGDNLKVRLSACVTHKHTNYSHFIHELLCIRSDILTVLHLKSHSYFTVTHILLA